MSKNNIKRLSLRRIAAKHLKHFPQTVPRKNEVITMKLGPVEMSFDPARRRWEQAGGGGSQNAKKEIVRLKNTVKKLQEENNLLKYRQEVLFHMMTAQSLDLLTYKNAFEKLGEPLTPKTE